MHKKNKNILITLIIFSLNIFCEVEIRQVPPPREKNSKSLNLIDKPLYLGKFEVYNSETNNYVTAWKIAFISVLKNNRIFSDILESHNGNNLENDSYIIDIEIFPFYEESYDYRWTWPAVYPLSGYWPIQIRTGKQNVHINYTIYNGKNKIVSSLLEYQNSETINIYGFYRTSHFEKMIELTNLMAIDKCAIDIKEKLR